MGVLNLWKILNVTCQPIDLAELSGKTLAVDLSIWICENACMNHKFANSANTKPHLRALFFRCKSLLEIGCKLIFVREGDVIDLKQDTMKKRNNARFGISSSQMSSSQCSQSDKQPKLIKKRSRFDFVADEVARNS
jgi:flap endonuclease GEN